jgi:hypothetical protein
MDQGFAAWLTGRKFRIRDFLEPALLFPFGFLMVRFLSHGFDTLVALGAIGLLFMYLPLIIVIFDWKARR